MLPSVNINVDCSFIFLHFSHSGPQLFFFFQNLTPPPSCLFFSSLFHTLISPLQHFLLLLSVVSPSVTSTSQPRSRSSPAFPEEAIHKDYRAVGFFSSNTAAAVGGRIMPLASVWGQSSSEVLCGLPAVRKGTFHTVARPPIPLTGLRSYQRSPPSPLFTRRVI